MIEGYPLATDRLLRVALRAYPLLGITVLFSFLSSPMLYVMVHES